MNNADDEKTRQTTPGPARGAPAEPEPVPDTAPGHTLPPGTVIGGLKITGLIGEGGFGIVYLAYDPTLQRQVALKEYMPSSLASRASHSGDVTVRSSKYADTFNAGLRSFVNEARLLARFDHPALVKVHQFWQANKTAYMVMPYYQGQTLKAFVKSEAAQGRRPDEATLRAWLAPLLDALEVMHAEQCYHRDIAPDNILLTPSGPLLLDFGAARRVISDMTHALTVILKPGYAPIEQYGEAATMTQGPWTDLYALASVVYFAITGHSPITSVERLMGDPLPRLSDEAKGRYGDTFLNAIDAALAVKPTDRPQNVAEFRALLAGTARSRTAERTVTVPEPRAQGAAPAAPAATRAPAAAPALAAPRPMPPAAPARSKAPLVGGVLVAAVVAVALGWVATRERGGDPAGTAATPPQPAPAPAPTAAAAPPPAAPVAAPAPAPAEAPAPVAATAAPATGAAPAADAAARSTLPESSIKTVVVDKPAPRPKPAAPAASPTPAPQVRAAAPAAAPAAPAAPAPTPAVAAPAPAPRAAPAPAPVAGSKPARCTELLQKGAQGTLTLEDATFLRTECR